MNRLIRVATRSFTNETHFAFNLANRHILDRIDAMINLNGHDYVKGFVAEYNTHATEFKNALAQHLGRIKN
jgi:hypothetical protein